VKHPDAGLRRYRDLLVAEPTSVTAVRAPDDAWALHVEDALTAVGIVERLQPARVVDVGSGGGSPGIPLALVTGTPVTLLEATASKCDFLRRAVAALDLSATVVHARSEEVGRGDGRDAFDLALARALAPPPSAAELCLPLVRPGGHVVLWTARIDTGPVARAAAEVGGEVAEEVVVAPNRALVVLRKTAPTPDRFPRRPGMATTRPLGRVRSRT
jgi:16S rRNA (guanine527-N7)-methyltransferase